ncbi:CpaF family protein [Mycetocola tolaasinivorans]|nr:ATPase, T2SS/T4P/T4SS family [Mycetocola tolaasinivorans]
MTQITRPSRSHAGAGHVAALDARALDARALHPIAPRGPVPPETAPVAAGIDAAVLEPGSLPVSIPASAEMRRTSERVLIARRFGVLSTAVLRAGVSDIFLSAHTGAWYDRGGGLERVDGAVHTEPEVRALASRLIALGGRHIDEATPCTDVRLPGGIRVHAVLPPVAQQGTQISIRVPALEYLTLEALERGGFFGPVSAGQVPPAGAGAGAGAGAQIRAMIADRQNMLISGPTGSGKTTLLAAMIDAAPPRERVIAVEDVAELEMHRRHFISLQSRQANIEGAGHIGLRRLVSEALRMRPDRLVLGECRGAEIVDLFSALNTGHHGGAGTIHANSLDDVPARLEALGALAGLSPESLATQAMSALDIVLHLGPGHSRGLAAMGRLERNRAGLLTITPVWQAA